MHPRIARRRDALMAQYRADPDVRAIVWDSPLLYEAGLADQCDCVVFIETDNELRRKRALQSRSSQSRAWTAGDLRRFEKTQKPLDLKRNSADYKVVNNSDIDDLRRQVEDVFSRILSGV